MLKKLPVFFAVIFLASYQTQASGFDLSFSNETANLEAFMPISQIVDEGGQFTAGIFFNDESDVLLHAKMLAVGKQTAARVPYQLSFGAKMYLGELDYAEFSPELGGDVARTLDVGGIAIGGSISIQYPARFNPIDLSVESFFTPGITTFGDTETLLEIGARLSIEIVPQAKAFVGYRLLEVDGDNNVPFEIDDNVHFGIRLQF